jgi:small basic protein
MKRVSILRVVLAGIAGLAIGVIVTAIVNLVVPGTNLPWTLVAVGLSSLLSAAAGAAIGARQKSKVPTP